MGVHVQRVNAQVIGSQIETLKDLPQRQILVIPEYDDVIAVGFELAFDESEQVLCIHA